jgi:hypothetical protein
MTLARSILKFEMMTMTHEVFSMGQIFSRIALKLLVQLMLADPRLSVDMGKIRKRSMLVV